MVFLMKFGYFTRNEFDTSLDFKYPLTQVNTSVERNPCSSKCRKKNPKIQPLICLRVHPNKYFGRKASWVLFVSILISVSITGFGYRYRSPVFTRRHREFDAFDSVACAGVAHSRTDESACCCPTNARATIVFVVRFRSSARKKSDMEYTLPPLGFYCSRKSFETLGVNGS